MYMFLFFFFKQKTAYEMRISDWSSDVCSSDLAPWAGGRAGGTLREGVHAEGLSFKKACCPPNSSDPRSPGAAGNGKSIEARLIPLVSSSSTRRGEDQQSAVPQTVRPAGQESGCRYRLMSVVAVTLKKTKKE